MCVVYLRDHKDRGDQKDSVDLKGHLDLRVKMEGRVKVCRERKGIGGTQDLQGKLGHRGYQEIQ